jgi:hypothetical protein
MDTIIKDDFIWHLGYLGSIAGPPTAVSQGMVSWSHDGEYWLRLITIEGKSLIHVEEDFGPELQVMQVIGYIHLNGVDYSFTSWDEFMRGSADEDKDRNRLHSA